MLKEREIAYRWSRLISLLLTIRRRHWSFGRRLSWCAKLHCRIVQAATEGDQVWQVPRIVRPRCTIRWNPVAILVVEPYHWVVEGYLIPHSTTTKWPQQWCLWCSKVILMLALTFDIMNIIRTKITSVSISKWRIRDFVFDLRDVGCREVRHGGIERSVACRVGGCHGPVADLSR